MWDGGYSHVVFTSIAVEIVTNNVQESKRERSIYCMSCKCNDINANTNIKDRETKRCKNPGN